MKKYYLWNFHGYNAPKDKSLFPDDAEWDDNEKMFTIGTHQIELCKLIKFLNGDKYGGSNVMVTNFKNGYLVTFSSDGKFNQR